MDRKYDTTIFVTTEGSYNMGGLTGYKVTWGNPLRSEHLDFDFIYDHRNMVIYKVKLEGVDTIREIELIFSDQDGLASEKINEVFIDNDISYKIGDHFDLTIQDNGDHSWDVRRCNLLKRLYRLMQAYKMYPALGAKVEKAFADLGLKMPVENDEGPIS